MNTLKTTLTNKRFWMSIGLLLVGIFLVLQFVPIAKSNPPIIQEPTWDSMATRELAQAACFDCHSNETVYPWYADIAPTRILVRNHTNEGREVMNFSEWDNSVPMDEIEEVIRESEMPPWDYRLMHPEARLSDAQKDDLIAGLRQTVTASGGTSTEADAQDSDND